MPLERYVKSMAFAVDDTQKTSVNKIAWPNWFRRLLPNVFIVIGVAVLAVVVYPFVSYQLTSNRWRQETILSPVSEVRVAEAKGIISSAGLPSEMMVSSLDPVGIQKPKIVSGVDFTKASNWFPQANKQRQLRPSKVTYYKISIPKLKIDQALVKIGGESLDKSLIHYAGTALPGEYGNAVIFGHSILPIFYNPKNYMSIFSLLPTLKAGDEIFVDFDGISYKYVVDSYDEVKPEQVEVLEQRFDRQILTLITCVPPGTYLKRGIIKAYLVKL